MPESAAVFGPFWSVDVADVVISETDGTTEPSPDVGSEATGGKVRIEGTDESVEKQQDPQTHQTTSKWWCW